MYGQSLFAPGLRRTMPRLGVFCAASIALHVLTLVAYVPRGVPAAPDAGAVPVFEATLRPQERTGLERSTPGQSSTSPIAEAAPATPDVNQPRAGVSDGVNLPFPDKWFTAQELDVRAEPLAFVTIEYPEELAGSGIAGRVQIVIYIDERGSVRKVEVARAIPEGVFDKAAVRAWSKVRFSPAKKDGVAVKSQKVLELSYSPL